MRVSIIAAHSLNRVIGAGNKLPWHIPEDLKRFRKLTLDHAVVMGRKTFESIGKPLPRRRNVVVSRSFQAPEGVLVARTLDEAFQLVAAEDEVFVIGGGEIYRQTLDRATRMYLTIVEADVPGDAYFPEYDASAWSEIERAPQPRGELPFGYRYVTLERVGMLL